MGRGATPFQKEKIQIGRRNKSLWPNVRHGAADDCKVMLSHENQCATIVTPKGSKTGSFSEGGPTIENASNFSIQGCQEAGGVRCEIVCSDCSEPRFERF